MSLWWSGRNGRQASSAVRYLYLYFRDSMGAVSSKRLVRYAVEKTWSMVVLWGGWFIMESPRNPSAISITPARRKRQSQKHFLFSTEILWRLSSYLSFGRRAFLEAKQSGSIFKVHSVIALSCYRNRRRQIRRDSFSRVYSWRVFLTGQLNPLDRYRCINSGDNLLVEWSFQVIHHIFVAYTILHPDCLIKMSLLYISVTRSFAFGKKDIVITWFRYHNICAGTTTLTESVHQVCAVYANGRMKVVTWRVIYPPQPCQV